MHLRWAPGVFRFDAVDTSGPFDGSREYCASSKASDGDGGGVVVGCAIIGDATLGTAGVDFVIALVPASEGCSPLHFVTYGAPDGGDSITGTYTLEDEATYQVNQYRDGAADVRGAPCQPSREEAARAVAPTAAGRTGAASPAPSSGNVAGAIAPARSESRSGGHTVLFAGIAAALVTLAAAATAYRVLAKRT